jgi:hypothetical protein
MTHNKHERSSDMPRDPLLEEAFGVLVRHIRAPQSLHARVMARIAAARPTLRERLVRWLLPLWQPPVAGEPVIAPSTVFHTPLAPSDQEILMYRLAVIEERLEAAAKNLQDAREEQRELAALTVKMFQQESGHGPAHSTGSV